MKIAIAGTGYVGLVSAVVLAHVGHHVVCVDVDETKIEQLKKGICPIHEPDLPELMTENFCRLAFTTDYAAAYSDKDIIFIAVGTPEKVDGSANMSYVYAVAEQIAASVTRDCVVVVKSTVPIGTNEKVEQHLKKHLKRDVAIEVVSNPEFLSQGTAIKDMLHGSRIVVGTDSESARRVIASIYENLDQPVIFTDRRSAEMIKYASNDFLALKISYINEIANICEVLGANVVDVARGMGMDPRIGDKFLRAGIGYGGSCFPKDTKALHWLGNFHDQELKTVKAAIEVNENQKLRLIKKARKYYSSFEGITVAVLGLTFKPGTDDLREAPSLANIPILLDDGAKVKAYDPCGVENFKRKVSGDIVYCATPEETLRDADICFILTEWPEVMELQPNHFLTMRRPIILDGRNCYDPGLMGDYPLIYDSIGRTIISNLD
ncbi:UDP-glucose dehydrogenase family protein [Acetonema longum]|uniref:UDP-glucose 6-dehydrogenase n=1 Tax=Acetonema longum DSM 6540 TaxID=1009370 RepID=F7NLX6_9FIRM|nr:UDP-glucose/GDP-mannose dehydrogenase family protein [Acetonema longum]EGO62902.1 nucleotide sugar dehydrogenase [Acetonema longum DSM 6540]